jgi:hypothetical protein
MFLGRIVFFRLHESPRYLVHAGRKQDALESLQMISRFNGSELALDLEDVEDHIRVPPSHLPDLAYHTENGLPSSRLFDPDAENLSSPTEIKGSSTLAHAGTPLSSTPPDGTEGTSLTKDYSATGGSGAPLSTYGVVSAAAERRSFLYNPTPMEETSFHDVLPSPKEEEIPTEDTYAVARPRSRSRSSRVSRGPRRRDTISSVRSSIYEAADRAYWALPRRIRRPVRAWLSRFMIVLEPEWRRTTVLVWGAWWGIMLAFTMFNVYLPKLLETRRVISVAETSSLERTLWEVVIFTIGGCPGAVVRRLLYPVCISSLMSDFFPLLAMIHYNNKVRCMVDREAGTWKKVIPGREYVFDSVALPRFCAREGSGGCHCDHRWDKLKLIGSDFFSLSAYASILNGLMTGYVGCAIWVRPGLHCN